MLCYYANIDTWKYAKHARNVTKYKMVYTYVKKKFSRSRLAQLMFTCKNYFVYIYI